MRRRGGGRGLALVYQNSQHGDTQATQESSACTQPAMPSSVERITWIVAVGYKCLHDLEDLCYVRQRTCYIKYVNLINMNNTTY